MGILRNVIRTLLAPARYAARPLRSHWGRAREKREKKIFIAEPHWISPHAHIWPDEGPKDGNVEIGPYAAICAGAYLAPWGGSIRIGPKVFIGPHAILYGHGGLSIGANALIAGHVTIIPSNHNFERLDVPINEQGEISLGITIEDDVWIGTGARILDGVTIGKGAVVAAGAVVTKSVPANVVVGGVPARIMRSRLESASADATQSVTPKT